MPGVHIECKCEVFHAPESCPTENIRSEGPMRGYVIGGLPVWLVWSRHYPAKAAEGERSPDNGAASPGPKEREKGHMRLT